MAGEGDAVNATVPRVACVAGLGMLLAAAAVSPDVSLRCGVLRSAARLLEASVPNAATLLSHPDWQVRSTTGPPCACPTPPRCSRTRTGR
jgi:hypothetical protein